MLALPKLVIQVNRKLQQSNSGWVTNGDLSGVKV